MSEVVDTTNARRRQALTFAAWAISDVLNDQHRATLAELLHAQRVGDAPRLNACAAKLAAVEEITAQFQSLILKETHNAS